MFKSIECMYGMYVINNSKKLDNNNFNNNDISIIIAFKNEEKNLNILLNCLKNQTIKIKQIIFINDNSNDQSKQIIENFINSNKTNNYILLNNNGVGKKEALATGIKYSNSEYCLFTDADCTFSNKWVEVYNNYINYYKADIFISSVNETHDNSFIQILQCIEFESLQACTIGSSGINKPIMCNGANMCVKRKVWIKNYEKGGLGKQMSGDDVFMLHSIKKDNGIFKYIKDYDASVFTSTATSIFKFFNQRMRWGGKSIYYKDLNTISYALIVFLYSIFIVNFGILSIFDSYFFLTFISSLSLKIIADFTVLFNHTKNNNIKFKNIHIIIFSILHPLYIVISAIGGFFNCFKWK